MNFSYNVYGLVELQMIDFKTKISRILRDDYSLNFNSFSSYSMIDIYKNLMKPIPEEVEERFNFWKFAETGKSKSLKSKREIVFNNNKVNNR